MSPIQYQKSSVNVYTTSAQTLAGDAQVALSTVGEKSGCSICVNNNAINLVKPGLYLVIANAVITDNGATGVISFDIYKNGTAIPGTITSHTVTAVGDGDFSLASATLIQVPNSCCCVNNNAAITIVNSGISAVYNNINVNVIKLA